VAAQLTRRDLRTRLAANAASLHIPPRVLGIGCAVAIAITAGSLFAAIHNARRDEDTARARFADAQALLSLPPVSTAKLESDLALVNLTLGLTRINTDTTALDPASDETTALLVRRATADGLTVKGITRANPAQLKTTGATYDIHSIQVVVEGTTAQITAFLSELGQSQPTLVPSLTAMTISDAGAAHAEIAFNVYTKVVAPTPVAPVATPKAKK
jgi:glycine cleavage system regulatory protein